MSGLSEELQRRISAALDAGGLDTDPELVAKLADDADARLYADDVGAIDAALAGLGAREDMDWDAMADRIDARLASDEALDDLDVTAPPALEAEPAAPIVVAAAMTPMPDEAARVVSLDAARQKRRRTFAAIGGLAAAAAVGLGITAGLTTMSDRGMESAASAPLFGDMEEEEAPAVMEPPSASPVAAAEAEAADEGAWLGAGDEAARGAPPPPAELPAAATATPARQLRAPADSLPGGSILGGARGRGAGAGSGGLGITPRPDPEPSVARGGRRRARAGGGGSSAPAATTGGTAGPGLRALGDSAHPSRPDRVSVVQALRAVEPQVRQCMGERRETATAAVEIDGPTGTVSAVTITSALPASVRTCIERQVRRVRFAPSSTPTYSTRYIYRPAPVAGGSLGGSGNAARRRTQEPASPRASEVRTDLDFSR